MLLLQFYWIYQERSEKILIKIKFSSKIYNRKKDQMLVRAEIVFQGKFPWNLESFLLESFKKRNFLDIES